MTAGRPAAVSRLSPAAVTEVVDRLGAAGHVTRRPGADDRRTHVIGPSAEHGDVRSALRQPLLDDAAEAYAGRPAPELRSLAEDLRRLGELNRMHARRSSGR